MHSLYQNNALIYYFKSSNVVFGDIFTSRSFQISIEDQSVAKPARHLVMQMQIFLCL